MKLAFNQWLVVGRCRTRTMRGHFILELQYSWSNCPLLDILGIRQGDKWLVDDEASSVSFHTESFPHEYLPDQRRVQSTLIVTRGLEIFVATRQACQAGHLGGNASKQGNRIASYGTVSQYG